MGKVGRYAAGWERNIRSFLLILGFIFLLFVLDVQAFSVSMIPSYILMSSFLSFVVIFPGKVFARHYNIFASYRFWYAGMLISVIMTLGSSLFGLSALFPVIGSAVYAGGRKTLGGIKVSEVSNGRKTRIFLLVSLVFMLIGAMLAVGGSMYSQEVLSQSGSFLLFLAFAGIIPYHKLEGLYLFYHNVFIYGIIASLMLAAFIVSFINPLISLYLAVAFAALAVSSLLLKLV